MKIFHVDLSDNNRITVLANTFPEAYDVAAAEIDPMGIMSITVAADIDIASPQAIINLLETAKAAAASREAAVKTEADAADKQDNNFGRGTQ